MEQDIITRKDHFAKRNASFYLIQPSVDPVTRIGFRFALLLRTRQKNAHRRWPLTRRRMLYRPFVATSQKTNCFRCFLSHSPHELIDFFFFRSSSYSLTKTTGRSNRIASLYLSWFCFYKCRSNELRHLFSIEVISLRASILRMLSKS